jgi:presenilin-like A22 family membrane protease
MGRISIPNPIFWGALILAVSQAVALLLAFRERQLLEEWQVAPPEISLGPPIAYFFGSVILLGLIFWLVPAAKLRVLLKILFALLFTWGVFIGLAFFVIVPIAVSIAVAGGTLWWFRPKIWFHDMLLLITLAGVGSVFGVVFSPWTALAFMAVLSIYDILAVRLGYMMWMVNRLLESETIPAFIFPKNLSEWNADLRHVSLAGESGEREFSVLGGGDIGFPLLLMVSVFFAGGLADAVIVAAFSLLGLLGAYGMQQLFLKGKPVPALPPISLASLAGFLLVYFT